MGIRVMGMAEKNYETSVKAGYWYLLHHLQLSSNFHLFIFLYSILPGGGENVIIQQRGISEAG